MDNIEKMYFSPEILSINAIILGNAINRRKMESLLTSYSVVENEYKAYWRRVIPNNYLKMHGIPMRRGRKRLSLT